MCFVWSFFVTDMLHRQLMLLSGLIVEIWPFFLILKVILNFRFLHEMQPRAFSRLCF